MAQIREDVGQEQHHGGVRSVRRYGETLTSASGVDRVVSDRQHRGVERAVASR